MQFVFYITCHVHVHICVASLQVFAKDNQLADSCADRVSDAQQIFMRPPERKYLCVLIAHLHDHYYLRHFAAV